MTGGAVGLTKTWIPPTVSHLPSSLVHDTRSMSLHRAPCSGNSPNCFSDILRRTPGVVLGRNGRGLMLGARREDEDDVERTRRQDGGDEQPFPPGRGWGCRTPESRRSCGSVSIVLALGFACGLEVHAVAGSSLASPCHGFNRPGLAQWLVSYRCCRGARPARPRARSIVRITTATSSRRRNRTSATLRERR